MKYRPDIDGLRAVAIVPVVLYHAKVAPFSGGFVGVDVFFVISGFLITSLIAGEIRDGRFSIAHFYERRVRRIFPALFATAFACSAAAAVMLPASELRAFGASVAAVALFVSNVLFWREAGYFDAPAEAKPLLHTWSLAVEEQFYIAFPLILLLLQRFLPGRWRATLCAVAAVSLLAGAHLTYAGQAGAAFYLAPFRAWELALGALAAIAALPPIHPRGAREAASVLGCALIGWSVFAYSDETPFPGIAALAPCVGTLLVVHAGSHGTPALNRLLSWRPVVLVGLLSYSLYLWHWPLLVFARRYLQRPLSPLETTLAVALALLLAWLSWRYIERPFRRHGEGGIARRPLLALAGAAMALALGIGVASQLVVTASPASLQAFEAPKIRGREDYRDGSCFLGETQSYADWAKRGPCATSRDARHRVLLWGDSFAAHYAPGLFDGAPDARYDFVQFTAYSCPPVQGARVRWAPQCEGVNAHLEDVLRRYPVDVAIVAARWERYWDKSVRAPALERTLALLKSRDIFVVLVGQGPSFDFASPPEYVHRTGDPRARSRDAVAINTALRRLKGYDRFFDPTEHLCAHGRCLLREGAEFLYWDAGHYSSYGSRRISANLLEMLPD